ncbi:DUF4191 domain-containing protein [Carbonactinospora thermoautotrophica]|uniref:DUF4191 domain-containing protein n=1 Tax=Carbonactinospora thermoautotrophica TaxID=1469144 RepID=UPI0022703888|nr:DUF4191 domain-containing protein [Carbonactinospora thermoautotrophica]MCX9190896.1 DUF4191 domain-containing protein [Carbonactinospora thermoautotrophica]
MARRAQKSRAQKSPGRLKQIVAVYRMTAQADPKVGWIVLLSGLGTLAIALVIGFVLGHPVYAAFSGLLLALLVMVIVFGRRAERAAYAQVEGQPGAAAGVLQSMRGNWDVTPAIAVNRAQDMVHCVVGRPGIVLVGEGQPGRVTNLIANQKRRMARIAGDAPIYEVIVGNGEGQVPLRKLQAYMMKLPRNLRGPEVTEVVKRLRAMPANQLPMPKGPLPKGMKIPRMPRGRMR